MKICAADKNRIYNVKDRPGMVYNYLEDSYAPVCEGGIVITGIVGEMWTAGKNALEKYCVPADELGYEPAETLTVPTDKIMFGIMIPRDICFTLEADYGEKALLTGNRPGIEHGRGDYILISSAVRNGRAEPDFSDSGRIVNGMIFEKVYREIQC